MASPIYATFHSSEHLVNDIISNAPAVDPQLMDHIRVRLQNSPTQLAYRTSIPAPQSVDAIGKSLVVMVAISR